MERGKGWSNGAKRWTKERKMRAKSKRIRYVHTKAMKIHSFGNINIFIEFLLLKSV